MDKQFFYKYKTILVVLFIVFVVLLLTPFSKATDSENEEAKSSSNKTYVVTMKNNVTFESTATPNSEIHATLMVPNGTTEPIPLVVMCHGFGGNRLGDASHFQELSSILAKNGIATISIDFPGCGESSAPQKEYTLSNMYNYVDSAIEYMTSNYDIDMSKIGITGHSMGGRVASMYPSTGAYGSNISALALWAPANGDGSEGYDFLNRGSFSFDISDKFYSEMNNSYPNNVLRSFSGSIYLAFDGKDASDQGLISKKIAEETIEAVNSVGGQVETEAYKNTDHNFTEGSGGIVVTNTANFFANVFLGRDIVDDGEEEEEPLYTIEDIIFNRIPILDINFFSDKAAGQEISEGSVVYILRTSVATWYVSFRNLVIIALAVMIIYIGIRMALSTIPSGKAKYKTMLISWIQALVIVMVIHVIMILTININNSMVTILDKAATNSMKAGGWIEDSIYETIRTRAYDFRASVGLPATLMYLVLIFFWLRFLWVYIKRSFTILILVVIAPFVGAKYAIDSASGKKGSSFNSWLYDFVFNVLIQTVHAIVYTALMTVAINFAFMSIVGYILALIIINFILNADEIFREIFNFSEKSSLSAETAKNEGYKEVMENLTAVTFVGQVTGASVNLAKGVGKFASNTGKNITNKMSHNQKIRDIMDDIDFAIESKAKGESDIARAIRAQAQLRRLSRDDGTIGIKARKLSETISKNRKKRFKGNISMIKNAAMGTVGTILAVPTMVINPVAGAAMLNSGIKSFKKLPHKKYYVKGKNNSLIKQSEFRYKYDKYTSKRDKNYKSTNNLVSIQRQEKNIRENAAELRTAVGDEEFETLKTQLNPVLDFASQSKINKIIEKYIQEKGITTIDNQTINDIIEETSNQLGKDIKLDSYDINMITDKAKAKVVFMNNKDNHTVTPENETENQSNGEPKFGEKHEENFETNDTSQQEKEYTKEQVSKIIQESIVETVVDNRFKDLAEDMFKLDETIKGFEKSAKTKYRGANKFLKEL